MDVLINKIKIQQAKHFCLRFLSGGVMVRIFIHNFVTMIMLVKYMGVLLFINILSIDGAFINCPYNIDNSKCGPCGPLAADDECIIGCASTVISQCHKNYTLSCNDDRHCKIR